MKTITPVTCWYNGQEYQANVLAASSGNDNLINEASFNYQLISVVDTENPYYQIYTTLVSGNLTMSGEAYQNWQTNDYAYDWVAEKLNLTITGEFVPPVPPAPEPEPENEPSPEEQSGL